MNPLKYTPAQLAKAIAAAVTAWVGLLAIMASTFTEGPLESVGIWAGGALVAITPVVVFLQRVQPWIGMIGGSVDLSDRPGE